MALEMYLKLDDKAYDGEAQNASHKGWIDILAWSWGCSQNGTTHMGSGSGAGKANFQDLSCTKWIDKSSPKLIEALTTGKHVPTAHLKVRKVGGKTPLDYYQILMSDVIITSVSTGGSGGEDRLTENVTLNFGAFKVMYIEQKADGGEAAKPEFSWDIAGGAAEFKGKPLT